MALANIGKEEVDLLLAQIKDIMDQKEKNSVANGINSDFSDDENVTIHDQVNDSRLDNLQSSIHHMQMPSSEYNSNKLESDVSSSIQSSFRPNMGSDSITVDALMRDLLKPLLKDWLNANLSSLVKEIVETKIDKLMTEYQLTFEKDSF